MNKQSFLGALIFLAMGVAAAQEQDSPLKAVERYQNIGHDFIAYAESVSLARTETAFENLEGDEDQFQKKMIFLYEAAITGEILRGCVDYLGQSRKEGFCLYGTDFFDWAFPDQGCKKYFLNLIFEKGDKAEVVCSRNGETKITFYLVKISSGGWRVKDVLEIEKMAAKK